MNKIKLKRIRRVLSTNKFKLIMIAMISLLLFTSTGYAILNSVQVIEGSATIGENNGAGDSNCEGNISVNYELNTSYTGTEGVFEYHIILEVVNESTEDIPTWEIRLKGPSDMTFKHINANIEKESDTVAVVTPLDWNAIIYANQKLTLDIALTTVEENFEPDFLYVNGCKIMDDTTGGGTDPPIVEDPTVELIALQINPLEYTMTVGEVAPLQVTKTPENAAATISWESNNQSVVSVDESGVITAISPGTAIITAMSGSISAQSTITVVEETPPEPSVTITLNPAVLNLNVGDTGSIVANITPTDANLNLLWSSDNNNVATVDQNGTIYANGQGTAIITVTAGDVTATAEVVVSERDVELISLQINPESYTMTVGEVIPLQVLKNPTDANVVLTWVSSDNNVASVSQDGQVTAISEGQTVITVSHGDISAQSIITVNPVENPDDPDDPEPEEPPVENNSATVSVALSGDTWQEGNGNYTSNFNIIVTNNSDVAINSITFTLNLPEGTKYNIWTWGSSINGNTVTWSQSIAANGSVTISGQISIPSGYTFEDCFGSNFSYTIDEIQ